MDFGSYVRQLREQRREVNRRYSVRQTAQRIGVEPAYLSKIERGDVSPPSEDTIRKLAADLGEDADLLLALAGKVSSDIREIVMKRPILFAEMIRG
ncbi:MAG: helix-turn-helix transcriptional regulator, partial [Candidatus Competibacter sp.]